MGSCHFPFMLTAGPIVGPIITVETSQPNGPIFEEITEDLGLGEYNVSHARGMVVDIDGDGYEEIVTIPHQRRVFDPTVFYLNRSSAGVSALNMTGAVGLTGVRATVMVFGDVDNDGDQDLFVGSGANSIATPPGIWLNEGGRFEAVEDAFIDPIHTPYGSGYFYKEMAAASFADFDGDGYLDLYVGTWYSQSPTIEGQLYPPADEIFKGQGDGTFVAMTLPDQHNPLTSQFSRQPE